MMEGVIEASGETPGLGPVLGIDPGTLTMGFGVVMEKRGNLVCLAHGTIESKSSKALPERLLSIGNGIKSLIEKYRPVSLSIERTFVAKNVDSASKLGHARGVCMYEAAKMGLKVFEYAPTAVKAGICGSGRAEKEQVALLVRALLGLKTTQKLDVTDALALAIHHLRVSQTLTRMFEHQVQL